jgi:preprotein translocase subunit YajC
MFTQAFLTATTATTAEAGSSTGSVIYMAVSIGLMIAVFYLFLIRPQKKKDKEAKNMRESLQIGDEVTTIGGIVGIIVRKSEDTVVIETGGDRSKIRVKIWAISENATVHDDAEETSKKKKD